MPTASPPPRRAARTTRPPAAPTPRAASHDPLAIAPMRSSASPPLHAPSLVPSRCRFYDVRHGWTRALEIAVIGDDFGGRMDALGRITGDGEKRKTPWIRRRASHHAPDGSKGSGSRDIAEPPCPAVPDCPGWSAGNHAGLSLVGLGSFLPGPRRVITCLDPPSRFPTQAYRMGRVASMTHVTHPRDSRSATATAVGRAARSYMRPMERP